MGVALAGLEGGKMGRRGGTRIIFSALLFTHAFSVMAAGGVLTAPLQAWSIDTVDVQAPDIAPAPQGGIYFASSSLNPRIGTLRRFSSSGVQLWSEQLSNTIQTTGIAIQSDSAGNAYVVGNVYGSLYGTIQGNSDVLLQKYSPDGALLWGTQFGSPAYAMPEGVALDASGGVYITSGGWQNNYGVPPPGTYTTTRQYSANGAAGWTTGIDTGDGTYPGATTNSHGVAVDSQGNVFTTFSNYTKVNNSINTYTYLAKLSSTGQLLWVHSLPNNNSTYGLALDAVGSVYVADGSLSKYDTSGNLIWSHQGGQSMFGIYYDAPDDELFGYAFNSYDNYLAGVVAEFDHSGQMLWEEEIPSRFLFQNFVIDSVTVSGNQLYAAGHVINGRNDDELFALTLPEPMPDAVILVLAIVAGLVRRKREHWDQKTGQL